MHSPLVFCSTGAHGQLQDALKLSDEYETELQCAISKLLGFVCMRVDDDDDSNDDNDNDCSHGNSAALLIDLEKTVEQLINCIEKQPQLLNAHLKKLRTWLFHVWSIHCLQIETWRVHMGLSTFKCAIVAMVLEKMALEVSVDQLKGRHFPPYLRGLLLHDFPGLLFAENKAQDRRDYCSKLCALFTA